MMPTVPYPFQAEDVRRMHEMGGRCLVAWDMGTGKSFGSLLFAKQHPHDRPIVIVCPASLKWVWEAEILKHTGWRSEILETTKPPRGYIVPHQICIVNFDILVHWLPYLKALKPKLAIIDECHYVTSRVAQRSEAVRQLCLDVPHILALGATPLLNRPAELWPILNILRPDLFPAFFPFALSYCGPKKNQFGTWEYKGASNLDGEPVKQPDGSTIEPLHFMLKKHLMLRRRKADVLKDLPKKRRIIVPLEIRDRKQYEQAVNDFIGWLREKSPKRAYRARGKMEAITKIGYLMRLVGRLKRRAVMQWLDDWLAASDGKLIVSAVHRKMIWKLHERYPNSSVVVDGSIVGKKRQLAFEQFLRGSKTRLLIGNIKAAGVGWSGKEVEAVAFAEYPWSPGLVVQMEDRISGISRGVEGRQPLVYFLTARETIETKVVKLLQSKQKTLCSVLDGEGKGDALNIFDALSRELLKEKAK